MKSTYHPAFISWIHGMPILGSQLSRKQRDALFPNDPNRHSPYGTRVEADLFEWEADSVMQRLSAPTSATAHSTRDFVHVHAHTRSAPDDGDASTPEHEVQVVAHTRRYPHAGSSASQSVVATQRSMMVARIGIPEAYMPAVPAAYETKVAVPAGQPLDAHTFDFGHGIPQATVIARSNGGTTENSTYQCVDLVEDYIAQLTRTPINLPDGKDCASAVARSVTAYSASRESFLDFILETPSNGNPPVVGAVISFSPTAENTHGHTAIVKEVQRTGSTYVVTLLEQNHGFGGKEVIDRTFIFQRTKNGLSIKKGDGTALQSEKVISWANPVLGSRTPFLDI